MKIAILLLLTVPAHVLLLARAEERWPVSDARARCDAAVREAYDRGHWDGWKKRSDAVGGGL